MVSAMFSVKQTSELCHHFSVHAIAILRVNTIKLTNLTWMFRSSLTLCFMPICGDAVRGL